MKNSFITAVCAFVVLLMTGCFKELSYDTTYVIRPYVQDVNQGAFAPVIGVTAYAFAVDTTDWMVDSYEDALAGVVTSKRDLADRLSATITATPYPVSDTIPSSTTWLQMSLSSPSMMIVAVDPDYKIYAYRQQSFAENLSPYFIALQLRPWRDSYSEGGWRVVNEFYVPPVPDPKPENPDPGETDTENPDTENPDDSGNTTPPTE